jgi:hypothetical protein
MQPYVPLFGETDQDFFQYGLTDDGEYTLTRDILESEINLGPTPLSEDMDLAYFTDMDVDTPVSQLAIPVARETKRLKSSKDIFLPTRKYACVRPYWMKNVNWFLLYW